jgi:hypothetical protein
MPKIKAPLEVEEPYYFDFLYEEIRNNDSSEILNTILFEAILRTDKMKGIYNFVKNFSSKKLEETLASIAENDKPLTNPLKEAIDDFNKKSVNLKGILEHLKENKSNEEMMNIFFNNDKAKYENLVHSLEEIEKIIKENILSNIPSYINLDFQTKDNTENINYSQLCNKYGLDFKEVASYLSNFKRLVDLSNNYKQKLINKEIYLQIYKKEVKRYVKQFRKGANKIIHTNRKAIIYISQRPLSNLLTLAEFQVPYAVNSKATMQIKKTLEKLKNIINEKALIDNTKHYLNFFDKNISILTKDPESFSKILLIYDWIEYSKQLIKFKNYSRRKKIEYLQERYLPLREKYTNKQLDKNNPLKAKTLENQLIEFNNLIKSLSEI